MRFIGWLIAGILVGGLPTRLVFGDDAGAAVGIVTGIGLYLWSLCPHCGESSAAIAPVCPSCGREKRGSG